MSSCSLCKLCISLPERLEYSREGLHRFIFQFPEYELPQDLGFRVQGLKVRVGGLGFRVQGIVKKARSNHRGQAFMPNSLARFEVTAGV